MLAMLIGVPKEIKSQEFRVGLTPQSVRELVVLGHRLIVEKDAGAGIGATDDDYRAAGADVAAGPEDVFGAAELIVKVKEPLAAERSMLRAGQALFTYLHLAPDPQQTVDLLKNGVVAIAYETVTAPSGGLPLLAPMSAVAGRMAVQVAAHYLARPHGTRGALISGVAGAPPGRILIMGAGVVGSNAALIAAGIGAEVTVINLSQEPLQRLREMIGPRLKAMVSTEGIIEKLLPGTDVVIGAALIPGARAPKLLTRAMLAGMIPGAVLVDVSIDQGGCFETSRPTTHADPVYIVDGILHYCVANMPGAVPLTSTYALNHATLPFVKELAARGVVRAIEENEHLRNGLNICRGAVTHREVAEAQELPYVDPLIAVRGIRSA